MVGVVALVLRLPHAGSFMTVDEYNWMYRSAEFWHQLLQGHPAGTFLSTHPGTPILWLSGAGILLQEQRLGEVMTDQNIAHFRRYAVAPVVLASAALLALAAYELMLVFGRTRGFFIGLWLAVVPYLLGMNQVVHPDALLGLVMVVTVLTWWLYLTRPRTRWAVLTGVCLGLALSTKLFLALWLGPVLVLMLVVTRRVWGGWSEWRRDVRHGVLALGIAAGLFGVLWPALFTQRDLQTGYLVRDAQTVITDEHVAQADDAGRLDTPLLFYPRTLLGRLLPLELAALVGGVGILGHGLWRTRRIGLPGWLLIYGVGYLCLITLAAKKADRYALPGLVALIVVAAWALTVGAGWLKQRRGGSSRWWYRGALVLMLVVTAVVTVRWLPHSVAYNNSLFPVRPLPQQGWGEGLEEAAAWLNTQPQVERLTVAAWYDNAFAPYFRGKTMALSSRADFRVTHVVTYRNMGGRASDTRASEVLEEVRDRQPVHTVFIQGVPYVWVYETENIGLFLRHTGEVFGSREVGQTVQPAGSVFDHIDVGFATYLDRANTAEVVLHVRESVTATTELRTVRVSASELRDNRWHRFSFEPLPAGRSYYVALSSPLSEPGNAVAVRFTEEDVAAGEMWWREPGQSAAVHAGDIAYRL